MYGRYGLPKRYSERRFSHARRDVFGTCIYEEVVILTRFDGKKVSSDRLWRTEGGVTSIRWTEKGFGEKQPVHWCV